MKQRIFFAVDFSLMCSRPLCVLLCHLITRIGYKVKILKMKSDLSLHNLTFEDAIELALDKSLWRLLVASGATH